MLTTEKSQISIIDFSEQVIERLSAEQVYSRYNHDFSSDYNGKMRGKPPFRESKSGSSFTVFPNKRFFDAGGNFAGSPIDYVHSMNVGRYERARGKDWVNALKDLADMANLEMPTSEYDRKATEWVTRQNVLGVVYEFLHAKLLDKNNPKSLKALDYLLGRGITLETIIALKIGFYHSWADLNNHLLQQGFLPKEIKMSGMNRGKMVTDEGYVDSDRTCSWKNFITFPWLDVNGNPLTMYGRYFQKVPEDPMTPKTIAAHGEGSKKHPLLYNHCIQNRQKDIVFVEGLFDAVMLWQEGMKNVCSGVAASFSQDQILCLKQNGVKSVTHLGDPDGGGVNGTKSNLRRLMAEGIDVYVPEMLPDGLDPDEFVIKHGLDKLREKIDNAEHGLVWLAKLTATTFPQDDPKYLPNILSECAKLEAEYRKSGVSKQLWDATFTKTINAILNIDAYEFAEKYSVEKEKVAEQVVENLSAVEQWEPYEIALRLAEKYRPLLLFDAEIEEWRRYGSEIDGVWSVEPDWSVSNVIGSEIYNLSVKFKNPKTGERPSVSSNFISGILCLLKSQLGVKRMHKSHSHLLPLKNGVLDLKTNKLSPHSQSNYLTWLVPYEYDPIARCEPIIKWLSEMAKDESVVQLIRAYFKAIVTGRDDMQRYIELVGPGGTGKSTVMRLATALIGSVNTYTTTLSAMENNRFECASFADKRLVLITDSDRYGGEVNTLKALTGGDSIRYEQKYKQAKGNFYPKVLVMLASNESIQSSDYTSGLARRRITIPFKNRIPKKKHRELISVTPHGISGEFADMIPGLLNWVIAMPDVEMNEYLRNTEEAVPILLEQQMENLLDTNPLADWVNHKIILAEGNKAYVGIRSGNEGYQLYASYCKYMDNAGGRAVALRRFSNLLHDLFNHQLNKPIAKYRDSHGTYFLNIAIRCPGDRDPLLITKNYTHNVCKQHNSNPLYDNTNQENAKRESLSTSLQNVGKNDGKMLDESLTHVGFDGCDGKIKNSLGNSDKKNVLQKNEENKKVVEIYQHNHQNLTEQGDLPTFLPTSADNFTNTTSEACNTVKKEAEEVTEIIRHEYKVGDKVFTTEYEDYERVLFQIVSFLDSLTAMIKPLPNQTVERVQETGETKSETVGDDEIPASVELFKKWGKTSTPKTTIKLDSAPSSQPSQPTSKKPYEGKVAKLKDGVTESQMKARILYDPQPSAQRGYIEGREPGSQKYIRVAITKFDFIDSN